MGLVVQFRHIKLHHTANLLLAALGEGPPGIQVSEAVSAEGLAFTPSIGRRHHQPEDLAALQEHGLIRLHRDGESWQVTVTPRGRDYLEDTII